MVSGALLRGCGGAACGRSEVPVATSYHKTAAGGEASASGDGVVDRAAYVASGAGVEVVVVDVEDGELAPVLRIAQLKRVRTTWDDDLVVDLRGTGDELPVGQNKYAPGSNVGPRRSPSLVGVVEVGESGGHGGVVAVAFLQEEDVAARREHPGVANSGS